MATFLGALFIVLFVALVLAGAIIYNSLTWGFVLTKFYAWFILSAIPTLPEFSLLQFIGFAFFIAAIMPKYSSDVIKDEFKNSQATLFGALLSPWITLLIGYLLHLFY